jgi:hypothetical protein
VSVRLTGRTARLPGATGPPWRCCLWNPPALGPWAIGSIAGATAPPPPAFVGTGFCRSPTGRALCGTAPPRRTHDPGCATDRSSIADLGTLAQLASRPRTSVRPPGHGRNRRQTPNSARSAGILQKRPMELSQKTECLWPPRSSRSKAGRCSGGGDLQSNLIVSPTRKGSGPSSAILSVMTPAHPPDGPAAGP